MFYAKERKVFILFDKVKVILITMAIFASCLASERNTSISLSVAELELMADSTDATLWGRYGLSLLSLGDPLAYLAFQTSSYLGDSPQGLRGRASLKIQSGEVDSALEILLEDSSDVFVRIMQCCIYQYSKRSVESTELIDLMTDVSLPEGAFELLLMRQARLSGQDTVADSISALLTNLNNSYSDIAFLDGFFQGTSLSSVDTVRIIRGLRADAVITGSVYFNQAVEMALSGETSTAFSAEILSIAGRQEQAESVLAGTAVNEQSLEEQILYANTLMALGDLSKTESVLEAALLQHPESGILLGTLGHVQLKGGRYQEAYSLMQRAVEQTGSPKCMAIMGLAAELAGEFPVAVIAYSQLLDMSADSVVLINRIRNSLLDESLRPACIPTNSNQWQNPGSGLRMNLSLSYFRSTGVYPQKSISVRSRNSYRYGLYNSRLSLSGSYSENSWPGGAYKLKRFSTSFDIMNYSTRNLFETLEVSMEQSREATRRWKLQAIVGCGYRITIGSSLSVVPSLGAGRIINKWDDDLFQKDAYVYAPSMGITISNLFRGAINPTLTLRFDSSCDIFDPKQYEIGASATISAAISRLLSISYSYSTEYQSIVPPDNNSETNTMSQASLTFHF